MTYLNSLNIGSSFLGLFVASLSSLAYSLTLNLTPTPAPARGQQERLDYQVCRRNALDQEKNRSKEQSPLSVKAALDLCREQYPAVSILTDCKRDAIKTYRNQPGYLKGALNECRDQFQRFIFNPDSPFPLKAQGSQVFFAGAGLNLPLKAGHLPMASRNKLDRRFGNFSCKPLVLALINRQAPEHILFGNDLNIYPPLKDIDPTRILKKLFIERNKRSSSRKNDTSIIHESWGEVHTNRQSRSLRHYFPSSYCQFDREIGNLYQDIKIYYLLDPPNRIGIPYFGIAFYHPQSRVPVRDLVDSIRAELGETYKIQNRKGRFLFIARDAILETDEEGDPYNLCAAPRSQDKVAIIAKQDDPAYVSYFLLSNVDNLCKHGDQLASRFLKRGL